MARPSPFLFVLLGLFLQYGQVTGGRGVHLKIVFRTLVPERYEAIILRIQSYRFGRFLVEAGNEVSIVRFPVGEIVVAVHLYCVRYADVLAVFLTELLFDAPEGIGQ